MKRSEQELEIGRRLRVFREHLKISRTAFALAIGIGSERLASYESGRAPLRYEVFSAVTKKFFLLPYWLGTGTTSPLGNEAFDDSEFVDKIHPKDLFSAVFDAVLRHPLSDQKYQATIQGRRAAWKIREISDFLDSIPLETKRAPWFGDVLDALGAANEALGEKIADELSDRRGPAQLIAKFRAAANCSPSQDKNPLTEHSESSNVGGMKSPMKILLGRLALVTEARGKKAALAKFLKVDPPRVSDWLRGNYEPSGEVTLRLLEWVAAEEAQQKTPGGAENAAKGKTRSIHSKDEINKSGPIKS